MQYVQQTNVDCLAIAIGTSHGTYRGEPYLDFELLQEIESKVDIPLVLHGGSGSGDENLQKAVAIGIQKVNLFTDLNQNGMKFLVDYMSTDKTEAIQDGDEFSEQNLNLNIRSAAMSMAEGYKDMLKYYINVFGSAGQS